VVIGSTQVAEEYLKVLEILGVQVGLHKSLESSIGVLEFAKRFIVKGVNLAPVPLREVWAAQHNLNAAFEFARKYRLPVSALAAVLGFGYKAIGSMTSPLSLLGSRLKNLIVLSRAPGSLVPLPLTEFLSFQGGGPVRDFGPTQRQSLFDRMRDSLLQRLNDLQPRLDVVRTLVTVDRTRAHYGTIDFPDRIEGYAFSLYEETNPAGRRFIHSLFEYVYREFFLDVLSEVRAVRTELDELTLDTSDKAFQDLIESINRLDLVLGALPLMPRSSARLQPRVRPGTSRWLKIWKSV